MSDNDRSEARTAWLKRVLQLDVRSRSGQVEERGAGTVDGAKAWVQARGTVVGGLRQLEAAIRKTRDPLADRAVILVRSIAAQLTDLPNSRQSVAELRRYLTTDEVIEDAELPNGFGVRIQIREPLLRALDVLEPQLPE